RYVTALGLPLQDAQLLISERELSDYFDAVLLACGIATAVTTLSAAQRSLAKLAANWISSELLGALNRDGKELSASPVGPESLAALIRLIADETVSGRGAKEVFARLYAEPGASPAALVDALGLRQITDPAAIEAACRKVIAAPEHQKQVEQYAKNPKLLGFFVGKAIAETGGRAKPDAVSALLSRLLAERAAPKS
ncbi:MAG TPA: hypothetical protein PKI03_05260, partial [Pseudomonadota bacterium]|nr:hypothetical protein [Pseudomonadota bacterium]